MLKLLSKTNFYCVPWSPILSKFVIIDTIPSALIATTCYLKLYIQGNSVVYGEQEMVLI